jgi:hypothetical protein
MRGFALLSFAEAGMAVPAIKVGDQVLLVGAALVASGQGAAGQELTVEQIGRLHNPIVQGE